MFLGSAKKQKDIDYEKKCIEQASSYSSNTISFEGFVEDTEKYYLNADIVVLTSLSEGQPRSIIEAMSYGLPCVSYNVTSVSDLLEKNNAGFVVPISDAIQAAEKLIYY